MKFILKCVLFIICTLPFAIPFFVIGTVGSIIYRSFMKGWEDGVDEFSDWVEDES